jgi:hypothetical protein
LRGVRSENSLDSDRRAASLDAELHCDKSIRCSLRTIATQAGSDSVDREGLDGSSASGEASVKIAASH